MRSRILRRSSSVCDSPAPRPPVPLRWRPCGLAQARCHVAEAGNFYLGAGGAGAGVAVKDLQDDHGAVHDLAAHGFFQIACLRWRDVVVDQQHGDAVGLRIGGVARSVIWRGTDMALDVLADLLAFAHAEISRGVEAGALLHEHVDDLVTQGLGQIAQFGQRRFEFDVADLGQLNCGNDGVEGLVVVFGLHAADFSQENEGSSDIRAPLGARAGWIVVVLVGPASAGP